MNKELKDAARAMSAEIKKLGEKDIIENPNRFYGIVCDTLYEEKYSSIRILIKKGIESGVYATIVGKKADRLGEGRRAAMKLVNTEFMAEAHAREIVSVLLMALDTSAANMNAVEKWVDELSVKTPTAPSTPVNTPTTNKNKNTPSAPKATPSTYGDPILDRAFLFIEDGNWLSAGQYAEKALDKDPHSSAAYLAKLLAELKIKKASSLANATTPSFTNNDSFIKACKFATPAERDELVDYDNKNAYARASRAMDSAKTEKDFKSAAELFGSHASYKDCKQKQTKCLERGEEIRKEAIYLKAANEPAEERVKLYGQILDYKDAALKRTRALEEVKELEEKARIRAEIERQAREIRYKREKKSAIICNLVAIFVPAILIFLDMLMTDGWKDYSGVVRWLWLPIIGCVMGGGVATLLGLLVHNLKISEWYLIGYGIAGVLWSLLRAVLVFFAVFGAAQGFWGWVGAIFGCLFVLVFNLAGWIISSIVMFGLFAENHV